MLACLVAVVLLGKSLAPQIESMVEKAGAPQALVGGDHRGQWCCCPKVSPPCAQPRPTACRPA
jgi:hypothetical protein